MFIRQLFDRLNQSLWFLPTVCVVVAIILSIAVVQLDRLRPDIASQFPLVFGGGPEGARGMLQAIASTVIASAATTFSITIVALTLSSSQFSPRVLRTFMGDRANQLVLATFMATFVYALLVLRTIRTVNEDGSGAFVPNVAVTGAILLAVLSLGMLIYFIHHIATGIQVSKIAAAVAAETLAAAERTFPEARAGLDDHEIDRPSDPLFGNAPSTVPALRSGYLADFDTGAIVAAARDADVIVRLGAIPGRWVQKHAPVFSVWPADRVTNELTKELDRHLTVGDQRSMTQDIGFGIQQLVDIGTKAISPGINDPTTAITCLDRLGEILVEVGRRRDRPQGHADDAGQLRLIASFDDWPALVDLAFDQLRHFSSGMPIVTAHLVRTLGRIRSAVPAHRHGALLGQARLVSDALDQIKLEADRARVERELMTLRADP